MSEFPRDIRVTLVCKTLPPIDEPAMVGLQDKGQAVHAGTRRNDGSMEFSCVVQARENSAGNLDFAGTFVHGTPSSRFLYLSWKRSPPAAALWVQRVKIPLTFSAVDIGAATEIRADITGRRPHSTESIGWTAKRRG
ncbi:DUF5990 family protein [Paraburkholderia caledonica]|uniref:Uncharacterized protein n=1 Tax=Paraburkholderia caledonica TaxID=134536 RepID=A0AB73II55_9BURK|nr:hypothetical protein [Paraburkholderia caledonica]